MHTGLTDHQARILQHHQTRCPPVPRISSTPGASGGPPARTLRRECDGLANPATKGPGACTRSPEGKTSTGHRQKYYDNVALSDIRSHEMRDLYGSRLPGRSLVKYDKTSLGQVSISLLFELGLFFCDRLVALLTLTFGYQDISFHLRTAAKKNTAHTNPSFRLACRGAPSSYPAYRLLNFR